VRTVEITLDRLEAAESQLELWEETSETAQGTTSVVSRRVVSHPVVSHPEQSEGPMLQHGPLRGVHPQRSEWAQGDAGSGSASDSSEASPPPAARALQHAIDRIRSRWGARGVVRGVGLALSGGGRFPNALAPPSGPG
jgi:hypothetical protein